MGETERFSIQSQDQVQCAMRRAAKPWTIAAGPSRCRPRCQVACMICVPELAPGLVRELACRRRSVCLDADSDEWLDSAHAAMRTRFRRRLSPQLETIGVLDQAAGGSVGQSGMANQIMPMAHWNLAGDSGRRRCAITAPWSSNRRWRASACRPRAPRRIAAPPPARAEGTAQPRPTSETGDAGSSRNRSRPDFPLAARPCNAPSEFRPAAQQVVIA